jgi:hypothetical protein
MLSYVISLENWNIPADPGGYRAHSLYTPYVNTCFASKFSLFLPPRCICLFLIWRCTNGSFVPLTNPRSLKYAATEMLVHVLYIAVVLWLLQRIMHYIATVLLVNYLLL